MAGRYKEAAEINPQALEQARQLDAEKKAGKLRGPLHGVPIALKDLVDTRGVRTTAASNVYKDRVPAEDAEIVLREMELVVLAASAGEPRAPTRRRHQSPAPPRRTSQSRRKGSMAQS